MFLYINGELADSKGRNYKGEKTDLPRIVWMESHFAKKNQGKSIIDMAEKLSVLEELNISGLSDNDSKYVKKMFNEFAGEKIRLYPERMAAHQAFVLMQLSYIENKEVRKAIVEYTRSLDFFLDALSERNRIIVRKSKSFIEDGGGLIIVVGDAHTVQLEKFFLSKENPPKVFSRRMHIQGEKVMD